MPRVKSNRVNHLCSLHQNIPVRDITRSPALAHTDTVEGDEGNVSFDYSKKYRPHRRILTFNERSGTVIAMAVTSQPQRAGFPLTLGLKSPRLPKRSWVKMSQMRTLSIEIAPVHTADDVNQLKVLFREYADSLGFDLCFQDFEEELRSLPGKYSPPDGTLLVAKQEDGEISGCVALRPLSPEFCEMKRLYVRPIHRGRSIGRALARAIIAEAAKSGYKAMRLDTVPSMKEAIRLYESLGFQPIQPYRHNPIPGAMYFELKLKETTGRAARLKTT